MEGQTVTIVCAWCRRVVKTAATDVLVSHTICPMCLEWTLTHTETVSDGKAPGENATKPPTGYFGSIFKR